jgi:hypothetical protein
LGSVKARVVPYLVWVGFERDECKGCHYKELASEGLPNVKCKGTHFLSLLLKSCALQLFADNNNNFIYVYCACAKLIQTSLI